MRNAAFTVAKTFKSFNSGPFTPIISARVKAFGVHQALSCCYQQRHSSSEASSKPLRSSRTLPLIIIGTALGSITYYLSTPTSRPTHLNQDFFVPYTITARGTVSPTSFILTISPHHRNTSLPYLSSGTSKWLHPLWSVEFRQPQVQIARHYTPLPPRDGDDPADGSLRFHVRAIGGGEMSTYLSRLGVGQDIWLRGPHVGFDLHKRLGAQKNVVFLAGGTGIAPGMQAAIAALEQSNDTTVSLLWAIRRREELQASADQHAATSSWRGFWSEKRAAVEVHADLENPSPVAGQLKDMKAKYGDRLRIHVAIDEEQTFFRQADIQHAIMPQSPKPFPPPVTETRGCRLHDPTMLVDAPEFEPPKGLDCRCGAGAGKNLLMISGPDGFIAHYAGAKKWLGGQQVQGPIGGVAAELQRKYPKLAQDWLVLKL